MPTLVVDIGGGSTELIIGTEAEISFHTSLQAGVVRHSERHIASDPPTALELEALAADVRGLIEDAAAEAPDPEAGIAVAGTPTSLAAIELELEPYDPDAGPRPRARAALDPADALAASPRSRWRSDARSSACTPTGRRRSSPASSSWSRRCGPSASSRSPSPSTTSSTARR